MLLAVDIGNSNIKFGIFDGEHLLSKFSIPTDLDATVDELRSAVGENLDLPISDAIVCSVVPEAENSVSAFLRNHIDAEPFYVRNDLDFGLKINYEPLSTAGTDRLVNSFSTAEKYGVPCVVCSFGTATTIDVVNSQHELLGGLIAPGFMTMAKSLRQNTAKLPEVEIKKPDNVLGQTTITSIRSGIFFSQLGLVESTITRIVDVLGASPTVVATGGFASMIATLTDLIDVVDEDLLLDGLRMLYPRQK